MAHSYSEVSHRPWRHHRDVVQKIDLGVALLLFLFTAVFSYNGYQNTAFILGLCGLFALWASFSQSRKLIYFLNMVIGLFFIFGS